jgi:hypothetical protein
MVFLESLPASLHSWKALLLFFLLRFYLKVIELKIAKQTPPSFSGVMG